MEDQFIYVSVRTDGKFRSESDKIGGEESSAVVGTELVWSAGSNCQREVSIVVVRQPQSWLCE
jgi:hypothetical protein